MIGHQTIGIELESGDNEDDEDENETTEITGKICLL